MESPETLRFASKEECILVFLATGEQTSIGTDIQCAYDSWEKMPTSEKLRIDLCMKEFLDNRYSKLYESMIRGFNIWSQTQDTEGAPGWRIQKSSVADVTKYIGTDLLKLLNSMEEAWQKDPFDHHTIQRVESLLKLGYGEKDLVEASQERSSEEMEDGWVSGRNEDISVSDLKKIYRIMATNSRENGETNTEETHVSYERLEDLLVDPPRALSPASEDNLYLEDAARFRDLLIEDRQADSDFEKQVSPILSVDQQD